MPPPPLPFTSALRVLRLGGAAPDQPDPLATLLTAAGLAPLPLPEYPPDEPEAFRRLACQARFALIDLDLSPASLRWLKAFRTRRPVLPIIASYSRAELPALLTAGSIGLDGAIKLPASPEKIAALLAPWLPPPSPANTPRSTHDSGDNLPSSNRPPALAATHLSPSSDANQTLLRQIDSLPTATRFIANGPVGAEFSLLARELAARRGVASAHISLPGLPSPSRTDLLVTDDLPLFTHSSAPFALLLIPGHPPEESSPPSDPCVHLTLKPLRSRLPDLAHYLHRWLPDIFSANHRPDPPFPLSPSWRHAFLAHPWPGEFSELYRAMHRLALLPPDTLPPPGFLAPVPPLTSFETLASFQIPRSYRARLARRIPAGLLPAVLSALGCPDPSPGHE